MDFIKHAKLQKSPVFSIDSARELMWLVGRDKWTEPVFSLANVVAAAKRIVISLAQSEGRNQRGRGKCTTKIDLTLLVAIVKIVKRDCLTQCLLRQSLESRTWGVSPTGMQFKR